MTDYPDPPANLPQAQQTIWADTITALRDADTVARIDPRSLGAYVAAVHAHNQATDMLTRTAVLVIRDGRPAANPALQVQRDSANTIRNFARAFGLTRAKAPGTPGQDDSPMKPAGQLGQWCPEHGRWECTHNRNRGRGPCHAPAKLGTEGCRMHAGSGQDLKHQAALARRAGGHSLDVSPSEVLLAEVRYTAGLCAWLDGVIAAMDQDKMMWNLDSRIDKAHGEFPGSETVHRAGLSPWVVWHGKAHDHNLKAAEAALRANVEERLVRLAEAEGARVFGAFHRGLAQLGLTVEQWEQARVVMPQVLRELAA